MLNFFKSKTMREQIERKLQRDELNYEAIHESQEQVVLRLGMQMKNGTFDTFIDIRLGDEIVLIYTRSHIAVPENSRLRISELITLVNYNMKLGNFELDMTDGELKYKTVFVYDSAYKTSGKVFEDNFYASIFTMDTYFPAFMSVIYGRALPVDAVNAIEHEVNPSHN